MKSIRAGVDTGTARPGEPRAASPPVGEHRVIIEHLPDDMVAA